MRLDEFLIMVRVLGLLFCETSVGGRFWHSDREANRPPVCVSTGIAARPDLHPMNDDHTKVRTLSGLALRFLVLLLGLVVAGPAPAGAPVSFAGLSVCPVDREKPRGPKIAVWSSV